MILPLEKLSGWDFAISGIRALRQVTPYRQLQVHSRQVNGFVFLLQGKCRFTFENGSISVEPGGVAYLPYGSCHVFDILTDDTEFYRMDFHLEADGETVLFSSCPLLVSSRTTKACADAVSRLATDYAFVQNSIAKTELMCRVLRELSAAPAAGTVNRLAAAVNHLSEHLTQKVSCKELAGLCHLSTARFYDLFREVYGMTPLQYRDRLLLQQAGLLLEEGLMSVAQIADMLGFESAAYFSRFFKKHMGIAPSRYET